MLMGSNPSGSCPPSFLKWRSGENLSGSGNVFSSCIMALLASSDEVATTTANR